MATIKDIATDLSKVSLNPQMMRRVVLNELESGGVTIAHSNDPVLFAIESAIMTAHSNALSFNHSLTKTFASMAGNVSDVYRHISDKDTSSIFSMPSMSEFKWVFDLTELKSAARPIPGSDIRKVVIPVNSEYYAKDLYFAQPYPLEIRILPHDAVQVRWDNTYINPHTGIEPGDVHYEISSVPYDGKILNAITITVPVEQYKTKRYVSNTIPNMTWSDSYTLDDNFYACRVRQRVGGRWVDLDVQLSVEVVDPIKPTAVLDVTENSVTVTIPDIYINTGMVNGELSVEILETKGEVNKNFNNYNMSDFRYIFKDHLDYSGGTYTNIFKQISLATLFSDSSTQGGRAPLSFEDLRRRVIDNTLGPSKSPLTDLELKDKLLDNGYSIYKAIDTATTRIYLAAMELPNSPIDTVAGSIGCVNNTIVLRHEDLINHPAVRVNSNRFTLTDDCIFNVTGSGVVLNKNDTLRTIRRMRNVDKVDYFSSRKVLSLPHHIVLDTNNDVVESRVYDLNNIGVTSRRLESTNDSLIFTTSTVKTELVRNELGYIYRCMVKANDKLKEMGVELLEAHLSFISPTGRAFKKANLLVDSEENYIWEWVIETNLNIDRNHNIVVDGFIDNNGVSYEMAIPLTTEFDIVFSILGQFTNELRTVGDEYLPNNYPGLAITHETHKLKMGISLDTLWVYSRPVPGTLNFERYEEDVPATYTRDVLRYMGIDEHGAAIYDKVAEKGQPIFESDGTPRLRHRKGQLVLLDGKPILKDTRRLELELDTWLVDARFLVATTEDVINYNKLWMETITSNALVKIPEINKLTYDRTTLKLTAKNTIGSLRVMLGNENITTIPAEQRFNVRYYVTKEVRQNQELLKQIKVTTNKVIQETLTDAKTVSVNTIADALKQALGDFIVDVTIDDLDFANGSKFISVLDNNGSVGVAKRLVLTPDRQLTVENDISITYHIYKK